MRIIKDYKACPQDAKGSVIALGNFDGVHKGHVSVINKAIEIAKDNGLQSAVLTFEPHPLSVLRSNIKPFRLTSEAQKIEIIEKLVVDNLFIINFDSAFSQIKAPDFIKEILVNNLGAAHIVTGEEFIFGYNRLGNSELLAKEALQCGFGYSQVKPVGGDSRFSSTLARKCLAVGDLAKGREILGRNFIIEGVVETGNQKGRKIGFPTVNISLGDYIRPAFGVYAVKLKISGGGAMLTGAANIGIKPTTNGTKELLEVHIFDFSENIYGHNVQVELIEYIRPERKFESLDALSKQITEDCNQIRKLL